MDLIFSKFSGQKKKTQLTLSCEHFDVDGTLDTDLLTNLWREQHLLVTA